jgi:hypothetical protein
MAGQGYRLERTKELFVLLKVLFPECKIRIILNSGDGAGNITAAQNSEAGDREK